ncbi:hypothetical protein [Streptomyces sp. enrichment culture]|uniref:hypothetical protein n=1 Tax=Streptomyces sp. enrichment culture TaxID=1795815 RepID=UPI003F572546
MRLCPPTALRLTPTALRLTPTALRLTPTALRLTPTALCLTATAALLVAAPHAHAGPARTPYAPHPPAPTSACSAPDGRAFPLTTRIRGGPASYRPGGGPGVWYLDLTNTTDHACTGVHPVVVLADEERALRPGQPRLDFYAGGRPHRVRFEVTDQDELVGAFADDAARFPGFSVGPGRTLTVKVRLALTEDAVPNEVTATAAVVQRHDDDGEWVGRSNDYRFTVAYDAADPAPDPDASAPTPGALDPSASPRADRFPSVGELARTGPAALTAALAAASAALLAAGSALLARHRRRRG